MAINRMYAYWVDAYGATRMTTFNYDPAANPLTISNQLVNASNGGIQAYTVGPVVNPVPVPVFSPYAGVQDAALLLFQDTAGQNVKIYLPAPALSIFLADDATVDPANADVVSIVTAVLASGRSTGGNPIAAFLGGTYQRSGRILQNG